MDWTQSVPLRRRGKARKTNRAHQGEDEHHGETWDRLVPSSRHGTICDDCRVRQTSQQTHSQTHTCTGKQERWTHK